MFTDEEWKSVGVTPNYGPLEPNRFYKDYTFKKWLKSVWEVTSTFAMILSPFLAIALIASQMS